ncbi:MAG: hypothetical protein O3A95_00200 [Planctomycetota bacterium]|nr:hypothetical protein [Planctomycetota bacterium]MDA1112710.1 hypothetical protein [Planctomycetota bacterium]
MRPDFALSLALLFGFGGLGLLFGTIHTQGPSPLEAPTRVAYNAHRGLIQVECAGQELRYFNVFLEETAAPPIAIAWPVIGAKPATPGLLELDVWSGRHLSIDVAAGSIMLSGSSWEDPPLLTWGPDWASVTWRTADSESVLQWRRAGEESVQEITAVCDSWDGLKRRVWLKTLKAGERIELRYRPSGLFFPPRSWTEWQEFEVPKVDPSGNRPTSRLQ